MIYDLSCTSLYIPKWEVKTIGYYRTVSSSLTWTGTVRNNQHVLTVGSSLSFSQSLKEHQNIITLSVGNHYSVSQQAGPPPIVLNLRQTYFANQSVLRPFWEIINQRYTPVQSGNVSKSLGVSSSIDWSQTLSVILVKNLIVSNVYGPSSSVFGFNAALGPIFIAIPTPTLHFMAPRPKMKGHKVGASLHHTNVSWTYGSFSFTVRAPDFENNEMMEFSRVSRRSRGGDLIIYRDPMWPESISIELPFSLLSETDKNNFIQLFYSSLGQMVTYVDHFGLTWQGIILNPQEPIIQYGIGTRYKTKVKLQGGRV